MTEKDNTQELLDSRLATYGDRVANMNAAASMVNGYIQGVMVRQNGDPTLRGEDFAAIMALYKLYRFAVTPDYADNSDDVMGYMKMAVEVVGDKMIHARTADEYQEKKAGRSRKPEGSGNPYANVPDDDEILEKLPDLLCAAHYHRKAVSFFQRPTVSQADVEEFLKTHQMVPDKDCKIKHPRSSYLPPICDFHKNILKNFLKYQVPAIEDVETHIRKEHRTAGKGNCWFEFPGHD